MGAEMGWALSRARNFGMYVRLWALRGLVFLAGCDNDDDGWMVGWMVVDSGGLGRNWGSQSVTARPMARCRVSMDSRGFVEARRAEPGKAGGCLQLVYGEAVKG
ncbi:uncharacterized protein BKA78DRAFT_178848 [Phyllosticta capitalensis]|uniref:uncharacterized protein n=1 Tax=Phyllosticta capitalensis TaxID=121624 RepID=UPI00312F8DD4